jgi:hypothetical protein
MVRAVTTSTRAQRAVPCTSLRINLRLQRDDEIPAFGAYLRCERQHRGSHVILVNVAACMSPEHKSGRDVVKMTKRDRKRLIIATLMHEFGHALEAHFNLPVNERAIEKATNDWTRAWRKSGRMEP